MNTPSSRRNRLPGIAMLLALCGAILAFGSPAIGQDDPPATEAVSTEEPRPEYVECANPPDALVNHAPESGSELPPPPKQGDPVTDQVVTVDSRLVMEVFGNYEDDVIAFDAVSSDESVVRTQNLGSAIGLVGVSEGVTTVTLRAWNDGGCVTQTFGVSVEDPTSRETPSAGDGSADETPETGEGPPRENPTG